MKRGEPVPGSTGQQNHRNSNNVMHLNVDKRFDLSENAAQAVMRWLVNRAQ